MIIINTHFQGEITELQVAEAFLRLGYQVCKPLVADSRYDFIVDINHKLIRVQVKTASLSPEEDYIQFKTQSSHTNTKGTTYHGYSAEDVDYFATVFDNKCYLVPISEIGARAFRLRLKPTKNGQVKNINFAEKYLLENIFIN